jgi:hypothetical protein
VRHAIVVGYTDVASLRSSTRFPARGVSDWLYGTVRMIMLLRRVALELLGFGRQTMRFVL